MLELYAVPRRRRLCPRATDPAYAVGTDLGTASECAPSAAPAVHQLCARGSGIQRRAGRDAGGSLGSRRMTTWDGQSVVPGEDSQAAITRALRGSAAAVLLISSDFLATPNIRERELPALLARRRDEGLWVLPILVRDCLWQEEPTLGELQIAPKSGRAVIRYRKENGERDRIWNEIVQELVSRLGEPPPGSAGERKLRANTGSLSRLSSCPSRASDRYSSPLFPQIVFIGAVQVTEFVEQRLANLLL